MPPPSRKPVELHMKVLILLCTRSVSKYNIKLSISPRYSLLLLCAEKRISINFELLNLMLKSSHESFIRHRLFR